MTAIHISVVNIMEASTIRLPIRRRYASLTRNWNHSWTANPNLKTSSKSVLKLSAGYFVLTYRRGGLPPPWQVGAHCYNNIREGMLCNTFLIIGLMIGAIVAYILSNSKLNKRVETRLKGGESGWGHQTTNFLKLREFLNKKAELEKRSTTRL